ncbi:uncharacterized protein N7511_007015 [Penicillium nucicola]|uniref:uncharacterized protein n=1 Tax=Penicillium nucicola TaxID=1850975 RepID=UPI0025453959|nr:uncharacterized protein N7511_007015 [Penicillium nucicola]KAJ5758321.1 hypothetical protein N7511_007015 [Penicillium nucicola]
MSAVTSHLMRRSTELAAAHLRGSADKTEPQVGIVILIAITAVVFSLAFWAIEYTFSMVVATLAAIEDTNPDIYVRITSDPNPIKPTDEDEPEIGAAAPLRPITSKLRTTISHLRARAGFWSRFRGAGMFVAYAAARSFIAGLIPIPVTSCIGSFVVQSFVGVLFATWQMAWVHIVISEPSPKRFYQRIPSFKTWIKIAPAAAVQDILTAAAFFLPLSIANFAGFLNAPQSDEVLPLVALFRFMGVLVVPAILAFLVSIPARVIFIRVAASMLPEEDETIVPFDRSFGGKVTPAITGGSGKIGIVEAWTTFDWAARVRYAKVIGKTFAMEVALVIFASLVLGGQLIWAMKTAKPVKDDSPAF